MEALLSVAGRSVTELGRSRTILFRMENVFNKRIASDSGANVNQAKRKWRASSSVKRILLLLV